MLKKRKCPRIPRRIEIKINDVTLVIKHPIKWTVKVEHTPPLVDTPLVPFVNDIKFEAQQNAIRRMYNFWVKGEV